MNVNQAVAKRISDLLLKNNMTQYRLERNSGILHQTLAFIMQGKNKTVTLSTVIMIAKGFNMTLPEFLDDPLFDYNNLEVEQQTTLLQQKKHCLFICEKKRRFYILDSICSRKLAIRN